jgi:hypothetical protein
MRFRCRKFGRLLFWRVEKVITWSKYKRHCKAHNKIYASLSRNIGNELETSDDGLICLFHFDTIFDILAANIAIFDIDITETALINTQTHMVDPSPPFSRITFERVKIFDALSRVPGTNNFTHFGGKCAKFGHWSNRKCNSTKNPGTKNN